MEPLNLKHLNDAALISKTKSLAVEERRLVSEVIHYLREINRRRLYAARGYESLFAFTVKELGYSDASAYRRINAMRLLSDLPAVETQKIEESLKTGELSLSNLSQLQGFLVAERKENKRVYTPQEKTELITSLKCKSSREAEKVLAAVSPQSVRRKELTRAVSATETLVQFTADAALMAKLQRTRELLSHRLPDASMASLLNELADLALKSVEPARKPVSKCTATSKSAQEPQSKNPRYIPQKLKTELFQKAGGCCQYVDSETGRRCESRAYLQVDHRTPVVFGGTAHSENLRILCAVHNQYEAWWMGIALARGTMSECKLR